MAPDYDQPSAQEIAAIAERGRYVRDKQGRQQRTWHPSDGRGRYCRRVVFVRAGFTCRACGHVSIHKPTNPSDYDGAYLTDLVLDHVTPYVDGGLFYPDNLQALCPPCNSRKGARP